jgi:hypothetical protein
LLSENRKKVGGNEKEFEIANNEIRIIIGSV